MLFSVHTESDGQLVVLLAIFRPWIRVRYRVRVMQKIWLELSKPFESPTHPLKKWANSILRSRLPASILIPVYGNQANSAFHPSVHGSICMTSTVQVTVNTLSDSSAIVWSNATPNPKPNPNHIPNLILTQLPPITRSPAQFSMTR